MILEVERAVDEVTEALRLALVDAMIQDPDADDHGIYDELPKIAVGQADGSAT